MAKVLNAAEVKELINGNGVVVVDFFATWCGPCQMFGPIFDEASEETDATLIKVDIDQDAEFAGETSVMGVPTIVAFNNGQEVGRFSGFKAKEELLAFIEEIK